MLREPPPPQPWSQKKETQDAHGEPALLHFRAQICPRRHNAEGAISQWHSSQLPVTRYVMLGLSPEGLSDGWQRVLAVIQRCKALSLLQGHMMYRNRVVFVAPPLQGGQAE